MKHEPVTVPDLGGADDVEVIEVSVHEGDTIRAEQTLIVLESEKASMEVPAPRGGTVTRIAVKPGSRVRKGDLILELAVEEGESQTAVAEASTPAASPSPTAGAGHARDPDTIDPEPPVAQAMPERRRTPRAAPVAAGAETIALLVPDLGGAKDVEVIEISVRAGDSVHAGDPLLVMESDKASMELPAPADGVIVALDVRTGTRIATGQRIGEMSTTAAPAPAGADHARDSDSPAGAGHARDTAASAGSDHARDSAPSVGAGHARDTSSAAPVLPEGQGDAAQAMNQVLEKESRVIGRDQRAHESDHPRQLVYAGPAVRQLARELGVPLDAVTGSGPKRRILKEDVQAWVKARLAAPPPAAATSALPRIPEIDFAAFGPVVTEPLGTVQKAIVANMWRSWLNVPRVTQFDYADVTELEEFRAGLKAEMEERGTKLTPLPFLLIAVARALREFPRFNASLGADGASLVLKHYFHIGIAVDTPQGLVVPVIRDVNAKGMWELAAEARDLAEKARARKLRPADMQGGCFTISSLGTIGGEGFTPIINAPEVAILGVSKLAVRPVWDGTQFQPRKTLPLSLSYDHRVINGADGGNFLNYLMGLLADIRRLLL